MPQKLDSEIFSAMQSGKPLKSYKKTILAKVFVVVLNPFSGEPEGRILKGDPTKNESSSIVEVWSDKELVFFERRNKKLLDEGVIIPFEPEGEEQKSEEEIYNTLSDEEMKKLLNSPFIKFSSAINKMTSVAPVYRLLNMAIEEEKSEKILSAIRARLSELEGIVQEQ